MPMMPVPVWLCVSGALLIILSAAAPGQAHMFSASDPLVSLETGASQLLLNSSSSWVSLFFASWCGHCKRFKPDWMQLAHDVKDWRPAVYLAVLDCGDESNTAACSNFGIQGYPTIKFFDTFSQSPSDGIVLQSRDPADLRQSIISELEAQKDSPPLACPPLEPISGPEVEHFFENNEEFYLALFFEKPKMYTAREVALDMVQYKGVSVRRVLEVQSDLVDKFQVSSFPSGFLLTRNGSISKIELQTESRAEYTKLLRALPGVKKVNMNLIGWSASVTGDTVVKKTVNSSVVYMADLEASIHYSLRVEVARFSTLEGDRKKALTNYVGVLKKYFPARPFLSTLLGNIHNWLTEQSEDIVSYKDFADVVNNKNQVQNAVLAPHVNYVGCQGSKPEYRGFPCTVWTLFHLLTVRAAEMESDNEKSYCLEVLQAMYDYVRYFFGCRECAQHFKTMADESMNSVRDRKSAVSWLWIRHNMVNKRLAGQGSDDPEFPKIQWPSIELCPSCRKQLMGGTIWNRAAVLAFLMSHYAEGNLSYEYLEDESVLLENQKKAAGMVRGKREVESEKEGEQQEAQSKNYASNTPIKAEEENIDLPAVSKGQQIPRHRPTIIKMKTSRGIQGEGQEEKNIVDLDSQEVHIFQRRTLQDSKFDQNNQALQAERLMDPQDAEFDHVAVRDRLLQRGIDTKYLMGVMVENGEINWKGRWVKLLEVGFSRLDISLCVILYFLTSMCLLAMYLYLSFRTRFFRQRRGCPRV
ncbi:sulfhydryl oxidase 1 [Pseudophryne corroboree]|uniref:sulfhydryl oxidase 1 n=1 Tax=Pseudophryne corroboree TaxID=495146 RepID=UPI003081EC12